MMAANQSETAIDGTTAVALIQKWKSDPTIRSEFGTFNTFRAYAMAQAGGAIKARNPIDLSAVHRAPAEKPVAPIVRPEPARVVTKARAPDVVSQTRLSRHHAADWPADLVAKLSAHRDKLLTEMSYGEAFNEARALVISENSERFA